MCVYALQSLMITAVVGGMYMHRIYTLPRSSSRCQYVGWDVEQLRIIDIRYQQLASAESVHGFTCFSCHANHNCNHRNAKKYLNAYQRSYATYVSSCRLRCHRSFSNARGMWMCVRRRELRVSSRRAVLANVLSCHCATDAGRHIGAHNWCISTYRITNAILAKYHKLFAFQQRLCRSTQRRPMFASSAVDLRAIVPQYTDRLKCLVDIMSGLNQIQ